jgi:hypothetical protein
MWLPKVHVWWFWNEYKSPSPYGVDYSLPFIVVTFIGVWHFWLRENMNPQLEMLTLVEVTYIEEKSYRVWFLVLNYENVDHSCSNTCLFFFFFFVHPFLDPYQTTNCSNIVVWISNQFKLAYVICRLPILIAFSVCPKMKSRATWHPLSADDAW